MRISKDTLQAIIRDYDGLPISEAELQKVMVILEAIEDEIATIRNIDLSDVIPACLPRADETSRF